MIATLATAGLLLAAEPRWGLTFTSPAPCIQVGELAERVEKKAGRPLFGAEPDLRIEGHLGPGDAPARWAVRLTLVDSAGSVLGTRDVSSEKASCRGIDDSLVLVIALMIETRLREPPPPPPPPRPAVTAPPPPPVESPRAPTDDFSRLLRRERSGIFLGGYPVDHDAFYGMVDRPDLQASLGSRRAAKTAAFLGGAAAVLLGVVLVCAEALGHVGQDSHWPIAGGFVSLGLGVAAIVIGAVVHGRPTTDDEDDGLIEGWNLKQRSEP